MAACPYFSGGTVGAICGPLASPPMTSIEIISTPEHQRINVLRPMRSIMKNPATTPRTSMISI